MPFYTDQLKREVEISSCPSRIISLVPSHTELLFDLNLADRIAGITKFCTRPADKASKKPKIGGTKQIDRERIASLNPDLIIANKEENLKEDAEWLMARFPVWVSDIYTLNDALSMILETGKITDRQNEASEIISTIKLSFQKLEKAIPLKPLKTAYFIWKKPYMVAAKHTFIDYILESAGFKNAFSASRYPAVSPDLIQKAQPDLIFLSSEPYPFGEKHIKEFQEICPNAQVILADGEMFSWYGSRLKYTAAYLEENILKKLNLNLHV